MAGTRRTDLVGKLSDLSEDAMQRLSDVPGGERLVGAINATRERVDELQKRVRGMDELEKRLAALERKVDKLAKGSPSAGSSRSSSKPTSSKQS